MFEGDNFMVNDILLIMIKLIIVYINCFRYVRERVVSCFKSCIMIIEFYIKVINYFRFNLKIIFGFLYFNINYILVFVFFCR